MSDVDVWLQQCEECEQWLNPDEDEIVVLDGSWICNGCRDTPGPVDFFDKCNNS